jgi:hypothetical protein
VQLCGSVDRVALCLQAGTAVCKDTAGACCACSAVQPPGGVHAGHAARCGCPGRQGQPRRAYWLGGCDLKGSRGRVWQEQGCCTHTEAAGITASGPSRVHANCLARGNRSLLPQGPVARSSRCSGNQGNREQGFSGGSYMVLHERVCRVQGACAVLAPGIQAGQQLHDPHVSLGRSEKVPPCLALLGQGPPVTTGCSLVLQPCSVRRV